MNKTKTVKTTKPKSKKHLISFFDKLTRITKTLLFVFCTISVTVFITNMACNENYKRNHIQKVEGVVTSVGNESVLGDMSGAHIIKNVTVHVDDDEFHKYDYSLYTSRLNENNIKEGDTLTFYTDGRITQEELDITEYRSVDDEFLVSTCKKLLCISLFLFLLYSVLRKVKK